MNRPAPDAVSSISAKSSHNPESIRKRMLEARRRRRIDTGDAKERLNEDHI